MEELITGLALDHSRALANFNIHEYASAVSDVVTEGVVTLLYSKRILDFDPSMYTDYLSKTISNMSAITANADELDNFFSNTYNSLPLENKKITIPLHEEDDITKIRPEYLMSFAVDSDNTLKKIMSGEAKFADVKRKYVDNKYIDKVKKQLVQTTLTINDPRDLAILDSPALVIIDSMYIQHNMIPFIRNYTTNVNNLKNITVNAIGEINNTSRSLEASFNGVENVIKSGKAPGPMIKVLEYAMSVIYRTYMNLCAYLSTMCIRKMSYYSFNIKSCLNLYNVICASFPESFSILHESVIDGSLNDVDDADLFNSVICGELNVIRPHIQNAVEMKISELTNILANKYGIKINTIDELDMEDHPYDMSKYKKVNMTLCEISNALAIFEREINNPDVIVDDAINKAELNETFISKYSDVLTEFEDTSNYTSENSATMIIKLLNEVNNYERNVSKIIKNMAVIHNYLEKYVDDFELKNTLYDVATYNELYSVLDIIFINFKDYVLLVAKKILSRLDNLTDALEENDIETYEHGDDFDDRPYDYVSELYKDEIMQIEHDVNLIIEAVEKEYYTARSKKLRGVDIVFEAPDNTNGGTTNTTTTGTGEDTTNTVTPGVEVKTNLNPSANTPKTDNKTTTTTNKNKDDGIIKAFKEFINKILEKFMKKSKSYTSKFNNWMAMKNDSTKNMTVKEYLLSLDYSSTTIYLANFEKLSPDNPALITDIDGIISEINKINASQLPPALTNTKTRKDLEKMLFKMVPDQASNGKQVDKFTTRVKSHYIYGNETKTHDVTGDAMKNAMADMIKYCEQYETFSNNVKTALDRLCKAAEDKQKAIIEADNGSNKVSDSQTAENGAVKENEKAAFNANSVILNLCKEYEASVLSVMEIKQRNYLAYIKKFSPISFNEAKNLEPTDNTTNKETK